MTFVVDQLSLLGLNENEVRVFTALATFGQMNITTIAGRSGLPRTTVDAIVRRLVDQGVVSREKVVKHWEYAVGTSELAEKLDALEKKLLGTGSREPLGMNDENIVVPTYQIGQVLEDVQAREAERGTVLLGEGAYAREIGLQVSRTGLEAGVLLDLVLHREAETLLKENLKGVAGASQGTPTEVTYLPGNLMHDTATMVLLRDVVYIFGGEVFHVERHFRTVDMFHFLLHAARESGYTIDLQTHLKTGVV